MAKSLQRDPQLESLLVNRKSEVGIGSAFGRLLGGELAFHHERDLGRAEGSRIEWYALAFGKAAGQECASTDDSSYS